jgi:hypothetical protein
MTTDNIKELSEKLAKAYGVDVRTSVLIDETNERSAHYDHLWLAEDSGRISDLADEKKVNITYSLEYVTAHTGHFSKACEEDFADHPSISAAARMARVRCLLAIKGVEE